MTPRSSQKSPITEGQPVHLSEVGQVAVHAEEQVPGPRAVHPDRDGVEPLLGGELGEQVGRGRDRAYAYFLYPPEKPLTETAHDRLATMAAHTDLGAGMQIAMKDLEIRGAGNLLGGEQSGHIQGVGFDLYVRMVGEAVAAYRGDAEEEAPEVTIELPVDAHVPHDYIAHERLRLEAYQKIAAAQTTAALDEVRAELVDRYGALSRRSSRRCSTSRRSATMRARRG